MLGLQACATTSGGFLHHIFCSVTNTILQTPNHILQRGSPLSTPPTCPYTVTRSISFLGQGGPRLEEQHLCSAVTTCSQLFPSAAGAAVISGRLVSYVFDYLDKQGRCLLETHVFR